VGSFSILPIGTYATSTNFHQPRDTTVLDTKDICEGVFLGWGHVPLP